MRVESSFTGDRAVAKRIQEIRDALPKQTRRAVLSVVTKIAEVSDARSPFKWGRNVRSRKVSVRVGAQQFMGKITYSAPHSIQIHEDLRKHFHRGQPKFLESATLEGRATALPELAALINLGRP